MTARHAGYAQPPILRTTIPLKISRPKSGLLQQPASGCPRELAISRTAKNELLGCAAHGPFNYVGQDQKLEFTEIYYVNFFSQIFTAFRHPSEQG
jgi:hypothetical protein